MLLSVARQFEKIAVGDAQTFESSLASIGRSVMSGKCPALFKHEIGFQILDSDEDNTRAVGVFGFRVGDRLLYAPLFYRDGRVKGTEQLRDPKRNVTVPLSDEWVNKILTDRGDEPGQRVSRNARKDISQPTLWQLKYPPSKFASEKDRAEDWVGVVERDLARVLARKTAAAFGEGLDLIKVAAEHPYTFSKLAEWITKYPWFGDAVAQFHGREKIAAAIKSCENYKPVDPVLESIPRPRRKQAAVRVVRYTEFRVEGRPVGGIDYMPKERDELMAGGNVYRDDRKDDEKTKITAWLGGNDGTGTTASNPTESGIYKVIGADWDEHECVVLCPLVGWHKGDDDGRCLVVRLKDKAHCYTNRSAVWTVGQAENTDYYNKWLEKLPDVGKKLPADDKVVAVGPCRAQKTFATVPFRVWDADTGAASETCGCGGSSAYDAPYWNKQPKQVAPSPWAPRNRVDNSPQRARVWDRPGYPFVSGNCLYVPSDAKILKIGDGDLKLASGSDADHYLLRFTQAKKAADAASSYLACGTGSRGFYADKLDGSAPRTWDKKSDFEADLVVDYGFGVEDAKAVVKKAAEKKRVELAVKWADQERHPGNMSTTFPSAPPADDDLMMSPAGFADDILPTESSTSVNLVIEDLLQQSGSMERYRPYPTAHGVRSPMEGIGNGTNSDDGSEEPVDDYAGGPERSGPSGKDLSTVAGAASTGRRELFDTAALASLVKHTRLRRMLDRVTPQVQKTVSGLADALCHLYWNVDEWVEQFGESEVGPIEDQMKDLFEGLGDLYLTLQEKQVDDVRNHGILPEQMARDGADGKD